MFRNRDGAALIFAIVLVALFTSLALVFLEKLYPFAQNVSGIERANMAYYVMISSIEKSLETVEWKAPWKIRPQQFPLIPTPSTFTGYTVTVLTGSNVIPVSGYGNSEYDQNWNIISLGQPIQLVLPGGIQWSNVSIVFRIPDLNLDGNFDSNDGNLNTNSWYVNWILIGSGKALVPWDKDELILGSSLNMKWDISIAAKQGKAIRDNEVKRWFSEYYSDSSPSGLWNCNDSTNDFLCTIKFSILRPLIDETPQWKNIPYLEYQITNIGRNIPLQFMTLDAKGVVYGYARVRRILIPQITTNAAFDFAVFQ